MTGLNIRSDVAGLEQVLLKGDLGQLNESQRLEYYQRVCASVGLNPLTQPFEYLKLNGREILYARRAATEQLRQIHRISITITSREKVDGCYVVTARATTVDGRTDENIGAVPVENLKGEAYANALMKAETKAKRRVTLAICGLSFLDESELDGVRSQAAAPAKSAVTNAAMSAHDANHSAITWDGKPIDAQLVPTSFDECITEEGLRAFAASKGMLLGKLPAERKKQAIEKCADAAKRCNVDVIEALTIFGLGER